MPDPDLDRFGSRRSTAYAANGLVATSQPLAAQAGVETLRDGDLAVADGQDVGPADATMPDLGPHTVTVPGTARGWEATLEELGTIGLDEALRPAIRYATEGYPVSEVISHYWSGAEDLFDDENARAAYLFDGEAPNVGQTVRLPELGRSMERIAEEGADVVYEGEIADAIVEEVQEKGGFLSRDDLA